MNRVKKSQILVVLLLSVMLISGACAQKGASEPVPTAEWDRVLAAARNEGSVSIYSTQGTTLAAALTLGMASYGIKVESIGGTGGELEQRIMTEQRSKAYSADLFLGGWTNQMNLVKAGYQQSVSVTLPNLQEKGVWAVDPSKYDPTKSTYVIATAPTPSVIINTDKVQKGEVKSWQDLLDPKWKDKMVMRDPRTGSGAGAAALSVWRKILGDDFWTKMASQRITLQAKDDMPVSQVALGEKSMALFSSFGPIIPALKAGAPIQIVHLKEGTCYLIFGIIFTKDAPHPNAAMVLLNWMFSKEGQIAMGRAMGYSSVRKDITADWLMVPELNPSSYTLIEPPNNVDPDAVKSASEFAKSIFGAQ